MHRFLIAGFAVAAVYGLGPVRGLAAEPLKQSEVRAANLRIYWQAHLPLPKGSRIVDLYRSDEYLYACGTKGELYAVLVNSGEIRWAQWVTEPANKIFKPTHVGYRAIVATASGIAVLDRLDGRIIKDIRPSFAVSSAAVSDGENIFCGSVNWRLYRLRLKDEVVDWEGRAGGPITATPVVYKKNSLYVAGRGPEGRVYSLGLAFKQPRPQWDVKTDGPIASELFVDENEVIAASQDRAVYLIDRINGSVTWRHRCDGPLRGDPHVTADCVYIMVAGRGLLALDRKDGRQRWILPQGTGFLSEGKKYAYIRDDAGGMLLVDRKSGKVRRRVGLDDLNLSAAETGFEGVFVGSRAGHLVCLMPASVPYLRLADLRRPATLPARKPRAAGTKARAPKVGTARVAGEGAKDLLESDDRTPPMYGALRK